MSARNWKCRAQVLGLLRGTAWGSGACVLLLSVVAAQASAWSSRTGELDLPAGSALEVVAQLDGIPWGMDWLPSEELIVTLKSGQIFKLELPTGNQRGKSAPAKATALGSVPATLGFGESGQGGLLDVKVSRDHRADNLVYFTYSKSGPQGSTTALARFKLPPKTAVPVGFEDVYVAKAWGRSGLHFGSRIAFGEDQMVFLSVGDRGDRDRAQDLSTDAGKILRLKRDGSVPEDNPFRKRSGASPAVYSYGHRNPQGLFYDPSTKQLYAAEHGPKGGDEINLIQPGRNYGWPVITFGREYSGPKIGKGTREQGMEQPQKYYTPSIAPSSIIRMSSQALPGLEGSFVLGALVLQHLNIVSKDFKTESRFLTSRSSRIRNVLEGGQGALYLATDAGEILRLVSSSKNRTGP